MTSLRTPVALHAGILAMFLHLPTTAQVLKSMVYDFDGYDLNTTSLPEGEYAYGDLTYQVVSNPVSQGGDQLGDRVLRLGINWNNGYAAFGRGISRYIEFNVNQDHINFYFYNPVSNQQNATFEIVIADDDNQSQAYENVSDDSWRKSMNIPVSAGWQLHSIPLKDFTDSNTGGNGIFDVAFTQNKGMLLIVEFRFNIPFANAPAAQFYIDNICFSEGTLPKGSGLFDLPQKTVADHCLLGAYQPVSGGNHLQIPQSFEGLFPALPGRRLKYVNTYLQWSQNSSTTANALPGNSIQTLINNGYVPIITWEPMYLSLAPLDPGQPTLSQIAAGNFNSYIDAFADKIGTYSDTVIIRPMHEFDGDWYPWCISQNNQDPNLFISAFRKIVDRFNAKEVNNVLWMWCPNSDYAPYEHWNWIVSAYPGDSYVDIVATDIYNGHYPTTLPWWRPFKWVATESYYYLTKYFPTKPFFICELGCRERVSTEPATSQTKADWFARMDKELQSNFRKTRALIFFNVAEGTTQDWSVNSTAACLESLKNNVWMDDYYFMVPKPTTPTTLEEAIDGEEILVYPNPAGTFFYIVLPKGSENTRRITIYNTMGQIVSPGRASTFENGQLVDVSDLEEGIYFVKISNPFSQESRACKLIVDH